MGTPARARRTGQARPSDRCLHGLADPARRRDRPRAPPRGPGLYPLIIIGHGTRRVCLAGITANPDGAWTTQAAGNFLIEPGPRTTGARFLIRDRADQFTAGSGAVFLAGGITIVASPPQAPKANAICEWVIGTLRREVPGRLLIVSERHLRQVVTEYLAHDSTARPHRALGQRHQLTLIAGRRRSTSPSTGSAEQRSSAALRPGTRSPPESSRPLPKVAGHHPDRVFEPHTIGAGGCGPRRWERRSGPHQLHRR